MKKKLALVMALVLVCGCLFAACGDKDKDKTGETGTSAPAKESVIPIAVSETQYMYATNPDGSYETVVATDAEGNTHTYLKGIKPGTAATGNAADQPTEMFEIENSQVVSNFIDILNSGNFLMDGYITSDGERMPLSFRAFGKNLRMGTEVSGIALDFAIVDDTTYLISDKNKTYIVLTEAIKKQLGFNEEDMSFSGFGSISKDDTVKSTATYNGKSVECYTATSDEGDIKFYVDGDNLVKIEMYDPQGVCGTMIETTKVQGGLTHADLEVPSDYKKTSYVAFIADLMGE